MEKIIACIDGSAFTSAVCDAAAWSAKQLNQPLYLLHTIERLPQHGADNLSGAIGLGARSALLQEMARLDEERSKLALQHGKEMLDAARQRATQQGIVSIEQKQRHGDIVDALTELEQQARLMIVGRSGEGHSHETTPFRALGSHIESLIRSVHTPLMIVPETFSQPARFMLAYDGRSTADQAIKKIIGSELLKGLECHLVMVKNNVAGQADKLKAAQTLLQNQGFTVSARLLEGNISEALLAYQQQQAIDLVVMGAFAHSKIRQLFLGSNTIRMIERSTAALIVVQ